MRLEMNEFAEEVRSLEAQWTIAELRRRNVERILEEEAIQVDPEVAD